jgi:hypothetical protein
LIPRRWRVASSLLVAGVVVLGGCSSDGGSGASSSVSVPTVVAPTVDPSRDPAGLPRVDLVRPAIAALEAQLGGPQQFFEINATSKLVNLIVALNDNTYAQAWLYLDGQLSSKDAQPASGHTFAASALTFDPATILAQISSDLPNSALDFFYVLGGADGSVQYKVDLSSNQGGQLEVVVAADGKVVEVDLLDSSTSTSTSTPTSTTSTSLTSTTSTTSTSP